MAEYRPASPDQAEYLDALVDGDELVERGSDLRAQERQAGHQVREADRRRRCLARLLLRGRTHERACAVERIRRDAEPHVRPEDVRRGNHRLGRDACEGGGQYLLLRELAADDEAG